MGRTGTDVGQLTREFHIKSNWRVRVESIAPFLSPVATHPDLAGLRSEVQGGRLARVDRLSLAEQCYKVVYLREPLRVLLLRVLSC